MGSRSMRCTISTSRSLANRNLCFGSRRKCSTLSARKRRSSLSSTSALKKLLAWRHHVPARRVVLDDHRRDDVDVLTKVALIDIARLIDDEASGVAVLGAGAEIYAKSRSAGMPA